MSIQRVVSVRLRRSQIKIFNQSSFKKPRHVMTFKTPHIPLLPFRCTLEWTWLTSCSGTQMKPPVAKATSRGPSWLMMWVRCWFAQESGSSGDDVKSELGYRNRKKKKRDCWPWSVFSKRPARLLSLSLRRRRGSLSLHRQWTCRGIRWSD